MTAPEKGRIWYRVDRDIPEILAVAGDLVMVDKEADEVWLCTLCGPDFLAEHRGSLSATDMKYTEAGQDDYSVNERPNHLALMD